MDKFLPMVGEVILRPITIAAQPGKGSLTYIKKPADVTFLTSSNGEKMLHAQRERDVDNSWVVTNCGKGMVCFIHGDVPDNFTHFTITRVGARGKNVQAVAGVWDTKQLLDLFTTPSEARDAHELLVRRVLEILQNKPDLLPLKTLVKRMTQKQLLEMCRLWFDMHRTSKPQEDRTIVMKVIREAVVAMDA